MKSTAPAAFEPSVGAGLVHSYPETRIGAFDFYAATCTEPLWYGSADGQRACSVSQLGIAKDLFFFSQEDPYWTWVDRSTYGYAFRDPMAFVDSYGLSGDWKTVPGHSNVRYRPDYRQITPNMHIDWGNGTHSVVDFNGNFLDSHGTDTKLVGPPSNRRLRQTMEGIISKFRDRARDHLKGRNLKCPPGTGLVGLGRKLNVFLNVATAALGVLDDIDRAKRAKANGISYDDQLAIDFTDAGPYLDTPLGLVPNPYWHSGKSIH